MFNLTLTNKIRSSLVVIGLLGMSTSVQADSLPTADVISSIEQNISMQTQEMMAAAKREFILSIQTQLAEAVVDLSDTVEVEQPSQDAQIALNEE